MTSRSVIASLALAIIASLPGLTGAARGQVAAAPGALEPGNPEPAPLFAPDKCGKACACHAAFASGRSLNDLLPGARFAARGPGPTDPTDVLNNNLSIEILSVTPGSSTASIAGTNVMTIRSNVNNLTSFTFRLRSQYTVSNCTVTDTIGSYTVTPTTPISGSYGRTITFARPINLNDQFTISISYSGNTVNVFFGSIYAGVQNGTGSSLAVCTLSEPYYAATWWPCKDGDVQQPGNNSDKATLDMAITAADTLTSVSNGLLVGVDTLSGNRKRYRWSTSYPLSTYLVFFSTSVYNQWEVTYNYAGGSMPVQFSIYPGATNDTAFNRSQWEKTLSMLETFEPVFGLYPFINEKYGIYQFEFNGGMEHQTYTGQGRNATFSETITAHELGHQWWGDEITCETWSDIWLNEGFASYSEALWAERKPGSSGLAALKGSMAGNRPANADLALANSYVYIPPAETSNPSRIFSGPFTYDKANWVVHMLRHVLGDTRFFNALAAYRTAKQFDSATTAEFTAIISASAGEDLSWFFNPWLYQPGAPAYSFGWTTVTINGQPYLRLNISQTQNPSNFPIFTMPVDVRITPSAGAPINTVVRSRTAADDFLIPLSTSSPITSVAIDPDDWILTTAKASVAYVSGPPKVVSLNPAPGASFTAAGSPTSLVIGFSDPVNVSSANIGVTRGSTSIPFTFAHNATTMQATLTFSSPLTAGTYNVAISDTITATANAKRLDGELSTNTAAALPSGDGVALGATLFTFTVTNPCLPDFNNSGTLEVQDIFDFLNAWLGGSVTADFNGGGLAVSDIFDFLNAWFAGC